MKPASVPAAVYLPSNEPYLGIPALLTFDKSISRAMPVHAEIGRRTFEQQPTPLQAAVGEIVPQGIGIALSIRELIRQAYLFSAHVLLRPLVERTGLAQYLAATPEAVTAWHNGWPRAAQPPFKTLVALLFPGSSGTDHEAVKDMLHKLVHGDPKIAGANMFEREDGRLAFASGKDLGQPQNAEMAALLACRCLRRLTAVSVLVFGHVKEPAWDETGPQGGGQ